LSPPADLRRGAGVAIGLIDIRPLDDRVLPLPASDLLLGNRLLAALPSAELETLLPHLDRVMLPMRQVLFEPGDDVTHAHFPADGTVVSLVCVMEDGRAAEAAMVGCEGAVGALISAGHKPASTRGVTQAAGMALRIESARLEEAKQASPKLRDLLNRFSDSLLAQVLQSVACNALHGADVRACRWLLSLQDRTGIDELPVTQEHMAELLGVQRTTVTRVIADLAAIGAVEPRRGRILITSRAKLKAAACECHAVVRRHFDCVAPGLYPVMPRPGTGQDP
jgi:CRP-like cAMP-binding protein